VTFTYYPALKLIYYSFTNWDGYSPEKPWVGLANYREVFSNPDIFISDPAAGSAVALLVESPLVFSVFVAAGLSVTEAPLFVLFPLFEPQPASVDDKIIIITKDNENNLFLIT
jgi:ABC-type sugar transport system permease subunit